MEKQDQSTLTIVVEKNGKQGVRNQWGVMKQPCVFDRIERDGEGNLWTYKDGLMGCVDDHDDTLVSCRWKEAKDMENYYFKVMDGSGKWGVMSDSKSLKKYKETDSMYKKSDIPAKKAFLKKLISEGYKAEIKAQPADIVAEKNGEKWYYEIKMTRRESICFGAATLTEWEQAFKTPDRFRFVIAIQHEDGSFTFQQYTPAEFMRYSTIPPFKVYFNIPLQKEKEPKSQKRSKAVSLTVDNFEKMLLLFKQMKSSCKEDLR